MGLQQSQRVQFGNIQSIVVKKWKVTRAIMVVQNNFDAQVPAGTPHEKLTTAQKYNDIRLSDVEDQPALWARLEQWGYKPMQINGVIRFLLESNWEIIRERKFVCQDFEPIL